LPDGSLSIAGSVTPVRSNMLSSKETARETVREVKLWNNLPTIVEIKETFK
jgi:hypothetical protein